MACTEPYFQFHYTASVLLAVCKAVCWQHRSEISLYGVDVGVGVGVSVGVEVAVCVAVGVAVKVGVAVAVAVDGAVVNVAVGGWELCRAMRALIHNAKSSWEEPLARTDRMNLTFSPLSVLRSMLIGYS